MAESSSVNRRDVLFGLAGAAISVPATAAFMKWLGRPKPEIKLLSFGLGGIKTNIKTPEKLRHLSNIDSWGAALKDHVTYEELQHRYRDSLALINQHKTAVEATKSWLRNYKSENLTETTQLDKKAITSHPLFQNDAFGPALVSSIKRLELALPPIQRESILRLPAIFKVFDLNDDEIILLTDSSEISISLRIMDSENKRGQMKLIAYSFAHGSAMNIAFYAEEFLKQSTTYLNNLKELSEELRATLAKYAMLNVKVALRNTGDSATAMRQHFIAALSAKNFNKKFALQLIQAQVNHQNKDNKDTYNNILQFISDQENHQNKNNKDTSNSIGNDPNTAVNPEQDEYLYAFNNNSITHMPEGQLTILNFQTKDVLGDDGTQIINLLGSGIIECSVMGITLDGNTLRSDPVSFGKDVNEREINKALGQ